MKVCTKCGGLQATEPMERIAGTPCRCGARLTNEQTLYSLMARILACASKHPACAEDPEFMRLADEACATPAPPSHEPCAHCKGSLEEVIGGIRRPCRCLATQDEPGREPVGELRTVMRANEAGDLVPVEPRPLADDKELQELIEKSRNWEKNNPGAFGSIAHDIIQGWRHWAEWRLEHPWPDPSEPGGEPTDAQRLDYLDELSKNDHLQWDDGQPMRVLEMKFAGSLRDYIDEYLSPNRGG